MAAVPVTVVTNTRNLGFPAAINQGLRIARGQYLVLLNNDVVVTDGWLDQLIALVSAQRDLTTEDKRDREDGREIGNERVAGEPGSVSRDYRTAEAVWPTPPGPPFTRGGKVLAPPSVDGADDQTGERCPAKPSRPTAGCLLPAGPAIGLVGPMSNYAAPPQLVDGVPYRDMEEMRGFARRWRDQHLGEWFNVPKLSGFCLLMKRAVYDAIGGLDERFGLGFFDDDDFAERARRAGFELAVAHDLFVHHFGSRTFAGNGIDAGKVLDENARRFADKWGLAGVPGRRVKVRPWQGNGASHAGADGNGDGWQKENLAPGRKAAKNADAVIARSNGEHHERSPDVGPCVTEGVSECVLPSSFATSRPGVKSSAQD